MRNLVKSLFTVFVFFALYQSADAQPSMYVHETNSTQTAFPLDTIRKLTFPSGVMQVHKNAGDTVSFAFSGIRYVDFSGLSTGVAPIQSNVPLELQLYCNNGCDELSVAWNSNETVNGIVEILDVEGRVVLCEQFQNYSSGATIKIPITGLASGVYVCRVRSENNMSCGKFLKY